MTCSIPGCESKKACRGWCWKHYDRWRKHGDPNTLGPRGERGSRLTGTDAERFWPRVDKTAGGCWIWTGGARDRGGYGVFSFTNGEAKRKAISSHRWAYEQLVGPVPDGLVLDHLCRNTKCVNPDHLEPVTVQENSRRAALHRKTMSVCGYGHAQDVDTVRTRKDGLTYCGRCANAAQAARRRKKQVVRKARAWLALNQATEGGAIVAELLSAYDLDPVL